MQWKITRMRISEQLYNIDAYMKRQSAKSISQKMIWLPERAGKIAKTAGEYINAPEQKLLLATTALLFQPLIDLKFAEEDKKVDSAIKSASKAIAGGITGVSIRALFMALTDKLLVNDKKNNNILKKFFYPDKINSLFEVNPDLARSELTKYNKTLGIILATFFMIFVTNSKVDVPLTSDFQDIIGGVVKDKKGWLKSISDVATQRGEKIKKYFKDGKFKCPPMAVPDKKRIKNLSFFPSKENKQS